MPFAALHKSTSRTMGIIRLESAKWAKADVNQVTVTEGPYLRIFHKICGDPLRRRQALTFGPHPTRGPSPMTSTRLIAMSIIDVIDDRVARSLTY
jgi:hypothetical protein